ncbi:MAG: hypothetical protein M1825_000776 [Sarcosagium campestre]|nr:MAG: hypothetical protein M1825_000776 [Sarcosagium campestre]
MPHAKAQIDGKTVAEADSFEIVEGNVYFPPSSVDQNLLTKSSTTTYCGWKGSASYYSIEADGKTLKDVAWYYAEPLEKATHIKDFVAFGKPVHVVRD